MKIQVKGIGTMERLFNQITQSAVISLVTGILSVVFGVTIGILGIVNGALMLRNRKKMTF